MDTSIIIIIIEALLIVVFCALNGYEIYKKYKDKRTLTLDDITALIKDLECLSKDTAELVEPITVKRSDFNNDEEYHEHLKKTLITYFDDLVDTIGLIKVPDSVYTNLSSEDKEKIVEVFLDRFEDNAEIEDLPSDDSDGTVDIGDHL